MTFDIAVLGWLALGVAGYFTYRAAWALEFGANPILVKTVLGSILCSPLGPLLFVGALEVFFLYHGKHSGFGMVGRVMNRPLFKRNNSHK